MRYMARLLMALTCLVGMLAFVAVPASAKVPGANGRIVFNRFDPTVGDFHAFASQPSWSPDGRRIVFSLYQSSTGHVDLFTAKADGSDLRQLTNTPDDEEFANWGTRSD